MSKRSKILVVDKKKKYSSLFQGFRKHKFSIDKLDSLLQLSEMELTNFNLFFIVVYETRDIFELLKIYKGSVPVIIASDNLKILKKLNGLVCMPVLDLSKNDNMIGLNQCMKEVLV